ncbi:hypothetical protein RI845_12105 [Thalassotalea nanhaiensis]|uniref:Uncharacterized protein n=1 Tax=Thalassotalea nanhaiensis TaxID=3065648 RepID=A0ABY9TEN8_9GAMM|nr:hypothetical protein RI845_12105 [Colwelliaceae bacterium SQ345]
MSNFINKDFMTFWKENKFAGSALVFLCAMGTFSILSVLHNNFMADIEMLVIQASLSIVFTISAFPYSNRQQ